MTTGGMKEVLVPRCLRRLSCRLQCGKHPCLRTCLRRLSCWDGGHSSRSPGARCVTGYDIGESLGVDGGRGSARNSRTVHTTTLAGVCQASQEHCSSVQLADQERPLVWLGHTLWGVELAAQPKGMGLRRKGRDLGSTPKL